MYLYKYYGVFGERRPDDEYLLVEKNVAPEDVLQAIYEHIGGTPYYVRSVGPDEQGISYYDYGSHSDFYVTLPRPWEVC